MASYLSCLLRTGSARRLGCKTMRCLVGAECRSISTSFITMVPKASEGELKLDSTDVQDEPKSQEEAMPVAKSQDEAMRASVKDATDEPEPVAALRFKYPEMFPEPFMIWRNPIKEKLERKDMLARRSQIYIPEFYVGSVLRVNLSNVHQHDKTSTFVGICIERNECGLKANFLLRNVIDNLGVEIRLELYDPKLHKIEVLRLERRLDTHLRYLRDSPPQYSTFPLDMKAEIRRTNEVPLNRIKVKLNPRPWTENWYKYDYKGIDDIEGLITNKMNARRVQLRKPWEKYDLMKTYRETLPQEEIEEILLDIKDDVDEHERKHKRRL